MVMEFIGEGRRSLSLVEVLDKQSVFEIYESIHITHKSDLPRCALGDDGSLAVRRAKHIGDIERRGGIKREDGRLLQTGDQASRESQRRQRTLKRERPETVRCSKRLWWETQGESSLRRARAITESWEATVRRLADAKLEIPERFSSQR